MPNITHADLIAHDDARIMDCAQDCELWLLRAAKYQRLGLSTLAELANEYAQAAAVDAFAWAKLRARAA